MGQPSEKRPSSPIKPQAGQRTDAKTFPHLGQFFALSGTSAPQLSQKKRGSLVLLLLRGVDIFDSLNSL
jgi:hypothetical protein